jgi:hypothetical protein
MRRDLWVQAAREIDLDRADSSFARTRRCLPKSKANWARNFPPCFDLNVRSETASTQNFSG